MNGKELFARVIKDKRIRPIAAAVVTAGSIFGAANHAAGASQNPDQKPISGHTLVLDTPIPSQRPLEAQFAAATAQETLATEKASWIDKNNNKIDLIVAHMTDARLPNIAEGGIDTILNTTNGVRNESKDFQPLQSALDNAENIYHIGVGAIYVDPSYKFDLPVVVSYKNKPNEYFVRVLTGEDAHNPTKYVMQPADGLPTTGTFGDPFISYATGIAENGKKYKKITLKQGSYTLYEDSIKWEKQADAATATSTPTASATATNTPQAPKETATPTPAKSRRELFLPVVEGPHS